MYIYTYIIYIYIYIYTSTCPPGHCHNSFMATGALGHTHVRLHVVDFQDSKKAQVNTTATNIIIDTSIYIYIYNMVEKNKHCR